MENPASGNADKSQLVQMRLQPKTIERIQNLSEMTGTGNRTQIVSAAIQLTEEILKSLSEGGKIYIEKNNGEKEVLKFVGL